MFINYAERHVSSRQIEKCKCRRYICGYYLINCVLFVLGLSGVNIVQGNEKITTPKID
jgi:hypothetical protein